MGSQAGAGQHAQKLGNWTWAGQKRGSASQEHTAKMDLLGWA